MTLTSNAHVPTLLRASRTRLAHCERRYSAHLYELGSSLLPEYLLQEAYSLQAGASETSALSAKLQKLERYQRYQPQAGASRQALPIRLTTAFAGLLRPPDLETQSDRIIGRCLVEELQTRAQLGASNPRLVMPRGLATPPGLAVTPF